MQVLSGTRYLTLVEKITALLLLIYPTLMLVIKGGMNGVFLGMLLLSLAVWLVRPMGMNAIIWRPEWTIYVVAMFAMSGAIFISQSYHHNYTANSHDAASRYFLAVPVFLLLQRLRAKVFTVLQIAFPVAAITGLLLAQDTGGAASGRFGIRTLDLIHFGDFEMILGMLSMVSINWFGRDKLLLRMLKVLGFIAGLAASFASGSRGGWLAIPVFIALFSYFKANRISLELILSMVSVAIATGTLFYSFNPTFHQRINMLTNEVAMFDHGDRDTSTGTRLQLYGAAVDIFSRHPIFGVGPKGFALQMQPLMEAGKITPDAANKGRGEVHNDILAKMAGMGLFGLIAILLIYWVPFRLFWRATKSTSAPIRRTGILGLTFVSGFLVFGLTVEILNLTMGTAFYSFTVAVLLAVCYNIHHGECSPKSA